MNKKIFVGFLICILNLSIGNLAHAQAVDFASSGNWAGYVSKGANYTRVEGTWKVPNVQMSAGTAADSTWVGIGGVSGTDLIQAGTQTIIENGSMSYVAWYEILPGHSIIVPIGVSAGDSVTVSIKEVKPNIWSIEFKNNSTGSSSATSVNYASSKSSVEWIQEMSSMGSAYIPLDYFGSVNFTKASAIENGVYATPRDLGASPVSMTAGGRVLASPTLLQNDGQSFMVFRTF